MQGQNLDRAGTCPCTDPLEDLMVHRQTQAWCSATPVDPNGASSLRSLALFQSTGVALHQACVWSLEWPCTIRYCCGSVQGHAPARSKIWPCTQAKIPQTQSKIQNPSRNRHPFDEKMCFCCPLGIVSNSESIWRGPDMVWKTRFEENRFLDPGVAGPVPVTQKQVGAGPLQ